MQAGQDIRSEILSIAGVAADDPRGALVRCESLLARDPACLPALVLAARLHRRLGEHETAAACLAKAAAVDAGALPVLAEGGALAMERADHAEAARCFGAITRARPELEDAWFNRGLALEALGQAAPAARAFARAAELGAGTEARVREAGALAMAGDHAGACERLEAIVAAEPGRADGRLGLGMLRLAEGHTEAARECFRAAVGIDPGLAEAWQQLLASCPVASADDPDLAAVLAMLDDPALGAEARERLSYAAGKALDDLGRYREAWHRFQDANALKRARLPAFDRDAWEAEADAAAGREAGHPGTAPEAARPLFIVGLPRSGTTLVEQIVTTHPGAGGVGELPLLAGPGRPTEAMAGFGQALSAGDAAVLTNKYPGHFRFVPELAAAFPGARFVHVTRHPLDTCLSIYFQDFPTGNLYANDLGDIAAYYRGYRRMMDAWRERFGERLLTLAYEALLDDQEAHTRALLEFCGLEWDPACLDFAANPRPVATLSHWQVRQPLYLGSRGRWRHYDFALAPLREALAGWL